MFCKNCGEELKENSFFCPTCGKPTDIVEKEEVLYKGDIKPVNQISKTFKILFIISLTFTILAHVINFFRPMSNFFNYFYGWNFDDSMMMNLLPVLGCAMCSLFIGIYPFKQGLKFQDNSVFKYLVIINFVCSIAIMIFTLPMFVYVFVLWL